VEASEIDIAARARQIGTLVRLAERDFSVSSVTDAEMPASRHNAQGPLVPPI
jgi:hypothetical protein